MSLLVVRTDRTRRWPNTVDESPLPAPLIPPKPHVRRSSSIITTCRHCCSRSAHTAADLKVDAVIAGQRWEKTYNRGEGEVVRSG